ncbi:MAG: M48 family metallopeptidase [Clostridiales bacterium]|nr:M48 family metallopeptidase [Clostridiales bacterium]
MEYELIRTRRKTVAIHIKEGRVIVRAPMRTPVRDIERFIESKQGWIDKHLAGQLARAEKRARFELTYGGAVLFLGREYRITADHKAAAYRQAPDPANKGELPKPEKHDRAGAQLSFFEDIGMQANAAQPVEDTGMQTDAARPTEPEDCLYFPPGLDTPHLKSRLILFYKGRAREIITERIGQIAPLMGVKPAKIHIGSAKRSWGSCNAKGCLSFSWRLMMAPPDAVDYVIVHELAHLKHLDHSKAFWAVVAKVFPDWKSRRQALRQLQKKLDTEDWG